MALYAIQLYGQSGITATREQDTLPVAGVDYPADAQCVEFYADGEPTDYAISNGLLTLNGVAVPYALGFKKALEADFESGALPTAAWLTLGSLTTMLNDLLSDGDSAGLQASWESAKAAYAGAGGPLSGNYADGTAITAKVEAYASQFGIPLVASK